MTELRPAIADIVELLSKKWVMRIIWELKEGPLTFRELQSCCGDISPTTLNARLKLLREALLVKNEKVRGYSLTEVGFELLEIYQPLGVWAERWQQQRLKHRS